MKRAHLLLITLLTFLAFTIFFGCEDEDLGYIDCNWVRVNDTSLILAGWPPLFHVYCVSDCPDGQYDVQKDCIWVHLYRDEERLEYKQSDGIHTRDLEGKNYTYDPK